MSLPPDGKVPELSSDPRRTKLLTNYLIKALSSYLTNHPVTTYADVFMSLHNLHKVGVLDLAKRAGMDDQARAFYFQMAVDTLSASLMRENARLRLEERSKTKPDKPD